MHGHYNALISIKVDREMFKSRYLLLAQIRTPFNLNKRLLTRYPTEFSNFLEELNNWFFEKDNSVNSAMPDGIKVQINKNRLPISKKDDVRYVSSTGEERGFLPRYIQFVCNTKESKYLNEKCRNALKHADSSTNSIFSKILKPLPGSFIVNCFDNTFGIAEMEIEFQEENKQWPQLEVWLTEFTKELLNQIYAETIYPALKKINNFKSKQNIDFILQPENYVIFLDMKNEIEKFDKGHLDSCKVLWVSKVLICHENSKNEEWIPSKITDKDKVIFRNYTFIFNFNYLITSKTKLSKNDLASALQGLYLVEYIFGVLDIIATNMNLFLTLPITKETNSQLKKLSKDMEDIVDTVTIFKIQYQELPAKLQKYSLQICNMISDAWGVKSIVNSIEEKLKICQGNISRLNQRINQRNALRIQLIMALVAAMGLMNLLLNISRTGEAKLAKEGKIDDIPGILNVTEVLSVNSLLWIGVLIAIVILTTITTNRPR